MNTKKQSGRKPGYPNRRQFLSILGAGALAAGAQAQPPEVRLGGVPLPPKPPPAATNDLPRTMGEPPAVTEGDPLPDPFAPGATNRTTHVVKAGETLSGIAKKKLGDAARWPEIQALNPTVDPKALAVGTLLMLPPLVLPSRADEPVAPGGIPVVPVREIPPRLLGKPANPR